ncbi:hypothetical protein XEUV354_15505 [Xanthomonas euvesicatoria]|nr:hypothetical protein BHE83_16980 [Xanthomonas euvesicatoria pv. vesicatoria str. 85-10]APO92137.1 hypothetical protein BJD11_20830 [Xanthomonas euvesicatoria]KHL62892.1 hypothetical protein XEU66b_04770 [Xanthomonas euvesicatoria]KHL66562.1 hypothetical protein XEU83M_05965 [Xanthomonas euvesicatoria]KLA50765.1 hypothetical protein XEUV685_20110 [Xanthomonas euvesicatoria]
MDAAGKHPPGSAINIISMPVHSTAGVASPGARV